MGQHFYELPFFDPLHPEDVTYANFSYAVPDVPSALEDSGFLFQKIFAYLCSMWVQMFIPQNAPQSLTFSTGIGPGGFVELDLSQFGKPNLVRYATLEIEDFPDDTDTIFSVEPLRKLGWWGWQHTTGNDQSGFLVNKGPVRFVNFPSNILGCAAESGNVATGVWVKLRPGVRGTVTIYGLPIGSATAGHVIIDNSPFNGDNPFFTSF